MSPGFNSTYDVRGWGHAYGLQFLLEARASGKLGTRKAFDEPIRKLVSILESTEIVRIGGWNYSRRGGASKSSPPSTFMTAATLQALFGLRPLVRDHFKLHERVQAAGPADGANDPESADQDAEAATTSCQE